MSNWKPTVPTPEQWQAWYNNISSKDRFIEAQEREEDNEN